MAVAGLLLTHNSAPAQTAPCCPETNGVKFIALPWVNGGMDVKDSRNSIVLADDFFCNTPGPITDIHIWGSWLDDFHGTITNFWLGIYNDVPAGTNTTGGPTPSHPGTNLLWQQSFLPYQFCESSNGPASETFYNPTNGMTMGGDYTVYYYCFYPTNPFVQQGQPNSPTNYWLAARAQLAPDSTLYGWKTSICGYNDAAVWGTVGADGLPSGDWQSMFNPTNGQPINLAFKITTAVQPIPCVETNGVKYDQEPNVYYGYGCLEQQPPARRWPPMALGGSRTTSSAPTPAPSRTSTCGAPGSMTARCPTASPSNSTSSMMCPRTPSTRTAIRAPTSSGTRPSRPVPTPRASGLPTPTNLSSIPACRQLRSAPIIRSGIIASTPPTSGNTARTPRRRTYWLAAFAELPRCVTNVFGWKTTTNVQHDISVHAPWFGYNVPPPNYTGAWQPNFDSNGQPFRPRLQADDRHQLHRDHHCPQDKMVECGTNWVFDPPASASTPAARRSRRVDTLHVVTNSTALCHQVNTAYWTITNCHGAVLKVCCQTVTVHDTTPPVLYCTNLVLACGDYSYTNPPPAYDACCGTNVTVTLVGSLHQFQLRPDDLPDLAGHGLLHQQRPMHRGWSTSWRGWATTWWCPMPMPTSRATAATLIPSTSAAYGLSNWRYQQVYDTSQFGAVPAGGAYITALAFRVDAGWSAFAATLPSVQINLSTTLKAPDGLSTTFANNVGGG